MVTIHNLGFPRIGPNRELKFALEAYWQGNSSREALQETARELRHRHWQQQSGLHYLPVGDFSLYDQVLDMSFTLGHYPERVRGDESSDLDKYFRVARGRSAPGTGTGVPAGEMTKWFDTNYHYIVPEFTADTAFTLNAAHLLEQVVEARSHNINVKPVIIGPLTYLWLGKTKDGSNRLRLLDRLLPVYRDLLITLEEHGIEWVQIDEPVLVTDLHEDWQQAFVHAYNFFRGVNVKLLLTTYFGALGENLQLACTLPVAGLHLDAINAEAEIDRLLGQLPADKVLSLGVINGRNIWKADLNHTLDWLEPIAAHLQERLWIAPSCSLLHVPVDLNNERNLDPEIAPWLAFALQKLNELRLIEKALNTGRASISEELDGNSRALASRRQSSRVHDPIVQDAIAKISGSMGQRKSPYPERIRKQRSRLNLPLFPTTTIGSFPQTAEIRKARQQIRRDEIDPQQYKTRIKNEIRRSVQEQETLGLDVLVHGEAERNDMVEYFGEQLAGFTFSANGWVQSYGSRCVKPPILYGDVRRPLPMTVEWITYAQSLTDKPMKGMLTGPVTILNWSFVRDDQPRSQTCTQLALAIRDEVLDLEKAGVSIIQIDEAALREGLPLRKSGWSEYLQWAVEAFRIAANGVADETQIHTHMCYSEFNDIIEAIAHMDADVITIETSRSDMELLQAFDNFKYPNEIGPGVYDIHTPNTPDQKHIVQLMQTAASKIPPERLWVNPDCGLKTRQWKEVLPALQNMVSAAKLLREGYAG